MGRQGWNVFVSIFIENEECVTIPLSEEDFDNLLGLCAGMTLPGWKRRYPLPSCPLSPYGRSMGEGYDRWREADTVNDRMTGTSSMTFLSASFLYWVRF